MKVAESDLEAARPVPCLRVLCLVSTGVTISVMLVWQVSPGPTRSPVLEQGRSCSSEVAAASAKI